MKQKIHCLEMRNENLDKMNFQELRELVGWIEPPATKEDTWDVTLSNGDGFSCETQTEAQTLAGIEEVKAMLMEDKD